MKNEIKKELSNLLPQMEKITIMISKAEDSWTDHFDPNDPDDMYLRTMFYRISDKLDDVLQIAQRAAAEVLAEGTLIKNSVGRYQIASTDVYFTTGSSIEYLGQNAYGDGAEWISSRVEHNGEDYYIAADPKLKMSGIKARIKNV
ncbi:DUF5348 domain-containing protein [Paenibacillus larvae]|uniref:DUF5348 domain-containing protein n=1 Tax=Paenibacillus larvae TaxID=1464 RepID=UPI00227FB567|nr:DUF5348 domain-containing protein [Paenibacillus larvae]MCY9746384.1 DUF5348 domain-containing protein [Paenibacillus larvae]MCY9752074.1 DUF5348 domain-containing protein [Paenibacillus larvae]